MSGLAVGQGATPTSPPIDEQTRQQLLTVMKEYREVTSQLQQIRAAARANNADLVDQQEQFQQQVVDALAETGYDVAQNRAEIKALGAELRAGDPGQERRKEILEALLAEQQEMLAAQKKVLGRPDIKAAAQELNTATLVAMRAQDSDTDDLMARAKDIQDRLKALVPESGS